MIFTLSDSRRIDTERDLTPAERHIIQKLLAWMSVVGSLDAFREKTKQAFQAGWNNSGPVPARSELRMIIAEMEIQILSRLKNGKSK